MAILTCKVTLDRMRRELQPHGSPAFPCVGYASHYTDRQEDQIPWHWHEELEAAYVQEGRMEVKLPSGSFLLKEHDLIIINSNTLHAYTAAPECLLRSILFHPALVTGGGELVFAQKYIQPLLSCGAFSFFHADSVSAGELTQHFLQAFEALAQEEFGFEFSVRERLSQLCLALYRALEPQLHTQPVSLDQDSLRLKKMLAYLHENYAGSLLLADVAGAANISQRECLRCFQKTIQTSPIQYLIKYRVMQGADLLLKEPAYSIAQVAARCGFENQSNFTKSFKRFYSCTPREYRKSQTAPPDISE